MVFLSLGRSISGDSKTAVMAYKGRPLAKTIAREFPFVVEILVPEGGLGRRLDDMHAFHRQRRITDHHIPRRRDDEHDYIRWCFKDLATAIAFWL